MNGFLNTEGSIDEILKRTDRGTTTEDQLGFFVLLSLPRGDAITSSLTNTS
jgi:hypothetical protein